LTRLGNVTAPLVSVGITTYRRPHFLVEAIGSVLQQTLKDLEIIICDDHSLDGTEEVVRRLNDGRIRYHCNRENLGMTRNINQCIRLARGKYFCWNSDDNVYLPRFLERLVGALESCPETGAAACSTLVTDYALRPYHEVSVGSTVRIEPPGVALASFLTCFDYNPSSVVYRREWLCQNRLLNESFLDDWAWLARYVYRYGCIRIPEALFCYRVHDQSQGKRLREEGENLDPVWSFLVHYDDIFKAVPESDRELWRLRKKLYRRLGRRGILSCVKNVGRGRFRLAKKQLREIVHAHPWAFVDPVMFQTVVLWLREHWTEKRMRQAMELAASKSPVLTLQASG